MNEIRRLCVDFNNRYKRRFNATRANTDIVAAKSAMHPWQESRPARTTRPSGIRTELWGNDMLTINPRLCALPDFLAEAQAMLSQLQECLSHLELICNDQDATDCLLQTLDRLSLQARSQSLHEVSAFCWQIRHQLQFARPHNRLQGQTLEALDECLTLLAWQIELIDPQTGQLSLDDDEQNNLIQALATCVESEQPRRAEAATALRQTL
jgi:hypothetical protein